jgi:hypothetical protein
MEPTRHFNLSLISQAQRFGDDLFQLSAGDASR